MAELITQEEIDLETRNHLQGIASLLNRIGHGSSAQIGAGYVEERGFESEVFTTGGWELVKAAQIVAETSAAYLWDVDGDAPFVHDRKLLGDVQRFMAVAAAALAGMRAEPSEQPGACPTWVATGLLFIVNDLLKRADAERVPAGHTEEVRAHG